MVVFAPFLRFVCFVQVKSKAKQIIVIKLPVSTAKALTAK